MVFLLLNPPDDRTTSIHRLTDRLDETATPQPRGSCHAKKSGFSKPPPSPISACMLWKSHPVGSSTRLALGRWGKRKSFCVRGRCLNTKTWRLFHSHVPVGASSCESREPHTAVKRDVKLSCTTAWVLRWVCALRGFVVLEPFIGHRHHPSRKGAEEVPQCKRSPTKMRFRFLRKCPPPKN